MSSESSHQKYLPENGQRVVICDLETTGFKADEHEIIEIGAVVTDSNLRVITEIDLKVRPVRIENASERALRVNGYTPEAWVGAVSLVDAVYELAWEASGALWVGHNSHFDWRFINAAFEQTGVFNTLSGRRVDNIHFTKHVLKQTGVKLDKYTQEAVAEYLGIEPEPAIHRAINGAQLAYQIYSRLAQECR